MNNKIFENNSVLNVKSGTHYHRINKEVSGGVYEK